MNNAILPWNPYVQEAQDTIRSFVMQKREIKGYSIVRPIFLGGMTDLYVATTPEGHRVVLRFLKEAYARNRGLRKRFLQSAGILEKLRHPHIVQIIDFGLQDKIPYMILDYVEARTLRELLVQRDPLLDRIQLKLIRQMADVLHFIHHAGYLHLDFKPENLLIAQDGHLTVIDFDLCVRRHRNPVRLRDYPGTPAYVAPEIISTQRADERADIFSFGVICFELLARRKPFERDTLEESRVAQMNPDTPPLPLEKYAPNTAPALRDLILKSLAKDVDRRYPSMSLVLKTIDSLT